MRSCCSSLVRWLPAVLTFVLAFSASCDSGGQQNPAFTDVRPGELAELLDDREVVIIDVRTPGEWRDGTVDGALRINLQHPGFSDRIDELDRDADYLIYCNSGNRSRSASRMMLDMGFERIYNYDGYHYQIREEYSNLSSDGS